MSRAFVKETDGDDVAEQLPERIHSEEPNYITPTGEKVLREKLRQLGSQHEALSNEEERLGKSGDLQRIDRDIDYLKQRLQCAIVVEQSDPPHEQVRFGHSVSLLDENANVYEFTIVGEDETDLDSGKISWTSALGRTLLQHRTGDVITWKRPTGDLELEVTGIFYSP